MKAIKEKTNIDDFNVLWKKIRKGFNWNGVYELMKQLGWNWGGADIPSICDIQYVAYELLMQAYESQTRVSSGGFEAYCEGNRYISLCFIPFEYQTEYKIKRELR